MILTKPDKAFYKNGLLSATLINLEKFNNKFCFTLLFLSLLYFIVLNDFFNPPKAYNFWNSLLLSSIVHLALFIEFYLVWF